MMKPWSLILLGAIALSGCARVEESVNKLQRNWDASPKTVTLYSLNGTEVRTYDIGRSKVTRAEGGEGYIYFYSGGKYVQTNMPYVVESK